MSSFRSLHPVFGFLFTATVVLSCNETVTQFDELPPEETGLNFSNVVRETTHNNILTYEYAYNGAGVAAGDINGDGLPDLYFSSNSAPNKLFVNRGKWKFEDITAASGTGGRDGWKTGVTMADVNGDGWLDLYVCYSGNAPGEGYDKPVIADHPGRSNELFINNGCEPGGIPSFTEAAREYGIDAPGTFSTQGYFFDYDRDGDLDLFLLNHANMFYSPFFNTRRLRNLRHPYFGNKLFRNDTATGAGKAAMKFTEVSAEAGLHGSGLNFGLSASISDLNLDGWPDLYVTNDYEEQDFCYINNRDGTFREASHRLFSHLSKFGMGSDIADINNDGLQDVVVLDMLPEDNQRQKQLKGADDYDRYSVSVDSGFHHQYMRNTLQLNRGFGKDSLPVFSEVGQLAGISNTDWSWSPFLVDFDNDGRRDLFVTNGFLRDFGNLDFMKYVNDQYRVAQLARKPVDYLGLIQELPVTRMTNYIFRNQGGVAFSDETAAWGLRAREVSNGAAYADFDNDGDYDLVTNNMNAPATVMRNNQERLQNNSFIKVRLAGPPHNTSGVGSTVEVRTDSATILQEAFFTRGYCSSVEPVMTIGLGAADRIRELRVRWPDGRVTILTDVKTRQTLVIRYSASAPGDGGLHAVPNRLLLEEEGQAGIDFRHRENNFVDFKNQRLLPYQLSRLGGKHSAGDVNADGNDDVFLEGAAGQASRLFLGRADGSFIPAPVQPWDEDAGAEDANSLLFDADGDGDLDLYVVSGGSEFPSGSQLYQDRVYRNDGNGRFMRAPEALPDETSSGGSVAAGDLDGDGDLDLFVGGRHSPGSYGVIPRSYLLVNESGPDGIRFRDATAAAAPVLGSAGMITDALWVDVTLDGADDLVVCGEWMPVRVFANAGGKLQEIDYPGLASHYGWWSDVYAADFDADGDLDLIAGNAGLNTQFKPTSSEPMELYVGDFNEDGASDPVLTYYIQGSSYPLATRDELLEQINPLRKKFVRYGDYAKATVRDFGDPARIDRFPRLRTTTLTSVWIENRGGKELIVHPLPAQCQFSAIHGFVADDFNHDGKPELLAAGNFFPFKPQLGRSDASFGTLLSLVNGTFVCGDSFRAPVWLWGDIRDLSLVKTGNSRRLLVSRNNERPSLYSY